MSEEFEVVESVRAEFTGAGISYSVELDSSAPEEPRWQLLEIFDSLAEIPRMIRSGAPVRRAG